MLRKNHLQARPFPSQRSESALGISGESNLILYSGRLFASGEFPLNTKEILEHINSEISRLQQVKTLLQGSTNGHTRSAGSLNGSAAPKVKGKRVLSAEARKKIAAAQRKRW